MQVSHSGDSVLDGNQDTFINLNNLQCGWRKNLLFQFSHMHMFMVCFAGFIQNSKFPSHIRCRTKILKTKANCLDMCILKERRIRIILMSWPSNILLYIS